MEKEMKNFTIIAALVLATACNNKSKETEQSVTPSDTIKGVRYPLEIHMVHKNKDGKFAVVSIMAQEDKKSNETFEFLDKYLPKKANDTVKVSNDFNINKVLPQNRSYYTYSGSLTTPPCTESVQWFIFKTPIEVSIKMITDLKKIMPLNNFRNVQELNGRKIKESI